MNSDDSIAHSALQHGAWLAVCDGSRALLLENRGDPINPKLETREFMTTTLAFTHELGTGRPGRTLSGTDDRRSAMEEPNYHLQAEHRFIQRFGECIEQKLQGLSIPAFVLIAPPRALGILREELGDCSRRLLTGSLARDYVHLPLFEIERRLQSLNSHNPV